MSTHLLNKGLPHHYAGFNVHHYTNVVSIDCYHHNPYHLNGHQNFNIIIMDYSHYFHIHASFLHVIHSLSNKILDKSILVTVTHLSLTFFVRHY